ncbi:glucan biosynthesis protein [Marinobacterium zhoushanense]|uniref:glucan biosynthesis protein n=1 Tax=Marinobacterium zhoushanense TaxID=1679163 RepID=UPI001E3CC627|nr:glucan biosynthesis protein G [Marinobacterium zhoushanense]
MYRTLLASLLIFSVTLLQQAAAAVQFAKTGEFSRDTVQNIARELAKRPFKTVPTPVPESIKNLTYDQYRAIRYRPEKAIWAEDAVPYRMQMFHRGFYYSEPVEIALVEGDQATHLAYDPEQFTLDNRFEFNLPLEDIGYAGLRLHTPLNKPSVWDELVVFQGASYFRSLGRDQVYGLSARGLALKTGAAEGEEFPVFKAFWVEKPSNLANSVVVHALLDSKSVTGAYRFTIRPGVNTVMDVQATLFPRVNLTKVGLAPGTSMYYFSLNGREQIDDFRPEVHDSDGLLMVNGRGERLWRPLANPASLQISAFLDTSPIGFGLIQRNRNYAQYQDLEAHYEKRPTLWVEPLGDWGRGAVVLTEIPTNAEIHDNIVAFWQPAEPIAAGSQYSYSYRLTWGVEPRLQPGEVRVQATRSGRADVASATPRRLFVVDYNIPVPSDDKPSMLPTARLFSSAGTTRNLVVRENPVNNGYRVSFEFDPQEETLSELRLELHFDDQRPAETWLYRWTAR